MKTTLIRTLSAATVVSLAAATAFAAPEAGTSASSVDRVRPAERAEMEPHVGVFLGATGRNGDLYNTAPSFMVDAGFQPIVPFSFALQTQLDPGSIDVPGADLDFNTANLLLKATYNFGGTIPVLRHSYVGNKLGATYAWGDVDSEVHAALGVTAGFDIPVSTANFTLGAEATYLGVLGEDATSPDQTSVLGAAKYWF